MNKIVYNACFGGFGLSDKAIQRYADIKGIRLFQKKNNWGNYDFYDAQGEFYYPEYVRHDPILVKVVEDLGAEANGCVLISKSMRLRLIVIILTV